MNNQQNKQKLWTTHIYISCKCDTNRAEHFTLDAHASRPVACPLDVQWCGHWSICHSHAGIAIRHPNSCRCCNSTTFRSVHAIKSSMEPSVPIGVPRHGDWPIGSRQEFPMGTQILPDVVTPNRWANSCHLKLYGTVLACRCAAAWSFAHQGLAGIPVGRPNSCRCITAGSIQAISNSVEPTWPICFWWFAFSNHRQKRGTCKVSLLVSAEILYL